MRVTLDKSTGLFLLLFRQLIGFCGGSQKNISKNMKVNLSTKKSSLQGPNKKKSVLVVKVY